MDITKKINEIALLFFDDNNSKFATALGTNEANIRNYRSKIVPKVDFIVKLCNDLEISFEWLFNDSGEMKKSSENGSISLSNRSLPSTTNQPVNGAVPLYEMNTSINSLNFFDQQQSIIDYINIPKLPKSDGAMYILGDGMYPLLKSGDIAIYKKITNLKEGIYYGEMYLLSINIDGDHATIVRYVQQSEKGEEYIKLVSYNTSYAAKDIQIQHVKAMALIKASIRINTMM
ncbi:transcriptional regulator [Pedobacter sp. PAMC26386]|nr:transcriptional regulator [Pedobacter sp. PAMC26386]